MKPYQGKCINFHKSKVPINSIYIRNNLFCKRFHILAIKMDIPKLYTYE